MGRIALRGCAGRAANQQHEAPGHVEDLLARGAADSGPHPTNALWASIPDSRPTRGLRAAPEPGKGPALQSGSKMHRHVLNFDKETSF